MREMRDFLEEIFYESAGASRGGEGVDECDREAPHVKKGPGMVNSWALS